MRLFIDQRFARVTVERFIETYFSEDFNNAVAKESGLKDRRLVDQQIDADGRRSRRVRLEPNVRLPAPISRFVDDTIRYDEVSSYDPARREVRFYIDSKARDRVRFEGTIRFVEDGDGVRRVIDAAIEVKVPFGLSGVVERFIEAETKKGYGRIAAFLQRWLDERAPP